ncbi:carboxypeptidase-like regulatory domain-containing protein [uncultured Sanguibacteroides sp.]|uniref:carboxypeptidase-like regulatory domain-containing protein n=1 Tax=uncultured Sanguibacteroides sp. TaxID=1635151 RepID=UPI0025FFC050|nr:carboxypeptidase-like regulatory domain-containing protein [uncultured Sanguibacteroides sp.]
MKSLVLKLFLFSFLLIGGGEVFAAKYYVGGDVREFWTKELLPGVTVRALGTTSATITDENGRYVLALDEAGTYTLEFSLVGFGTATKTVILSNPGEATIVGDMILVPESNTREKLFSNNLFFRNIDTHELLAYLKKEKLLSLLD